MRVCLVRVAGQAHDLAVAETERPPRADGGGTPRASVRGALGNADVRRDTMLATDGVADLLPHVVATVHALQQLRVKIDALGRRAEEGAEWHVGRAGWTREPLLCDVPTIPSVGLAPHRRS